MNVSHSLGYRVPMRIAALVPFVVALTGPVVPSAQSGGSSGEVTFTKDIAPILQRSCQQCHNPEGLAPMSLITYEEVRPYARAMKTRTGLGTHRGVMPPWFVEKNIGIQKFKDDPSPSEEEITKIAKWADSGASRGNPADMPPPRDFGNTDKWRIGEPDLVLRSPEVTVTAVGPDKWGSLGLVPTGLTEDRYVSAVQVREVNDIPKGGATNTVGGRFGFHHMSYTTVLQGEQASANADAATPIAWPVHEVGRNADIFPPEAGRLLAANSALSLDNYHLHSNGRETKSYLEFAFKLFPKGYTPQYKRSSLRVGNGIDIDMKPNQANQELHAYATLQEHTKVIAFEPHMHAPGVRMCLEAIWGYNIQTLNCVGYDHSWVRGYAYADEAAPLLPKGTIIHVIGFFDTTPANKNLAESRNWAGGGRRSVANMFIELGYSVALTEEQFQAEMAKRRASMKSRNDYDLGCPLCWAPSVQQPQRVTAGQGGN